MGLARVCVGSVCFSLFAGALLWTGCGKDNGPCRSLKIGQPIAGLPTYAWFWGSPPEFPMSPRPGPVQAFPMSQPTRPEDFTRGPAVPDVYCSNCETSTRESAAWCRAAADAGISCESEELRGIELFQLGEPYSYEYTDLGQYHFQKCFVAVKEGLIISVWSRHVYD